MLLKASLLSSVVAILGAGAAPALAQEPAPAPTSVAQDSNNNYRGAVDIVVTAQKRSESDVRVPVSLTTVTGESLEKFAVSTLSDVSKLTPQLVIGQTVTATGATINLRGIGGDPISPSVAQPVSIALDGIQISQGNVALLGLHDLARVEVLKGPQALYYGKNSPGGIISLVSNDPTSEPVGTLRAGYEVAHQQVYGEAILSGPITPNLGARLDVFASTSNGWFRNRPGAVAGMTGPKEGRAPGQRELFGRATLMYEAPDSSFTAKLKLSASSVNRKYGFGSNFQIFACGSGTPALSMAIPGASTDCQVDRNFALGDIDPATAATDPLFGDGVPFGRSRQYLATLSLGYDISDSLSLNSVTGYYRSNDTNSGSFSLNELTGVADVAVFKLRQFSQELRLSSDYDGPLNFVLGGYFEKGSLSYLIPVAFGPAASPVPAMISKEFYDQSSRAESLFGQLSYELVEGLKLSAGGRYSWERKSFDAFDFPSASNGFVGAPLSFVLQKKNFRNFSPEVTLSYNAPNDLNLYATYRTGFTSGGFNFGPFIAPGTDLSFDQVKVKGGEVGVKGLIADRQLKVQTAAYYYEYKGLQLADYDPRTLQTNIRNAGSATIYGAELSLLYVPRALPGLTLSGSTSYNHSRFDEYVGPCYGGQTIAAGCNLLPVAGVFGGQDYAGKPLPKAPRWSLNLGADYTADIGTGAKLNIAGDAVYSSSFFTDVQEDPRSLQRKFWKFNARVAVSGADDGWEVALIGKNLTNRLTVTNSNGVTFTGAGTGTAGPAIAQDLAGSIAEPRTVAIQLTLRNNIFN